MAQDSSPHIPILMLVDCEPDPRQPTDARPWVGFERFFGFLSAQRSVLAAQTGAEPRFAWFWRMDSQIEHLYGNADWPVRTYASQVAEMERLGIVLDLTHCSDQAFWQALEHYGGPVIASHNNCRALVPHQRQFSDDQLRAIVERGGVIGAALDAWMLKPGWQISARVKRRSAPSPCSILPSS